MSSKVFIIISFKSSIEVLLITSNICDFEYILSLTINGYDLKNDDVPDVLLINGIDPFNKEKKV
jgi:hypothetical protein